MGGVVPGERNGGPLAMRTILTSYRRPDGRRRRPRQTLGREWVTLEVLTSKGIVAMAAKQWSGWFAWSLLKESGPVRFWPDGWSYEEVKGMKRKGKATAEAAATAQASGMSKILGQFPHLVEHLNCRQYDDNAARVPGRLMVDAVGSMWRAIAKDVDSGMQLVVYMPSIDDCLTQLELLLGSDEAPWETDPYAREKTPRKKSK